MFEQQPQTLRAKVQTLSQAAIASNDPTRWFEELYAQAEGQTDQIPWARLTVHPHIQHWLEHRQIRGNGQRAMVVGCGLGDDAEALQSLGFQVTAFDIAETAIAWCRQRFPQSLVDYQVADLFALDPTWQQHFDLVVECRNVQALPLSVRSTALSAVAQLVAPGGTLLMVTRLRPDGTEPDGPPWPLSNSELAQLATQGLTEQQRHGFLVGDDPALPTVDQAWVEYRL
jgi:SAM-dependent methyltransferase